MDPIARLYPELHAGGFPRNSHRALFFLRVQALIDPDMTVLDFGAGRGLPGAPDNPPGQLARVQGKCRRLIGADIDPAVLDNPSIDEAIVLSDGSIPLPDGSVDLAFSWAVFEHIRDPEPTARELTRIIKPGGWLCSWTPNRWGYVGIGGRMVPNRVHAKLLAYLAPGSGRTDSDVFPTFYRLNTRSALKRYFDPQEWEDFSYPFNGPPGYHANRYLLAAAINQLPRVLPSACAQTWHVFMRRR
ncbi:MAG: class I SAM-dependent methyltransferase [Actinomycetota bacterium]